MRKQIECVRREIALRRSAYPRWVKNGRMTESEALDELGCMEQVERTLLALVHELP